MKALVVFESLWGNTELVAQAIAGALREAMVVDVVGVDSAPATVEGYALVVVGGPTHAFSMSRAGTRADAVAQRGAPHAPDRGIREWLDQLSRSSSPIEAVTFDTRVDSPRLPGSAARAAQQELRSLGFRITHKWESFRVHGYEGPLVDGELERAAAWAKEVALTLTKG
jgi:hypothetical protein